MAPVYDPKVAPVSLSRPIMRLFALTVLMVSDMDVSFTAFTFPAYCRAGLWYAVVGLCLFAGIYVLGCYKAVSEGKALKAEKLYEYVNKRQTDGSQEGLVRNYKYEKTLTTFVTTTTFYNDDEVRHLSTMSEESVRDWPQERKQAFRRGLQTVTQWQKDFDARQKSNTMGYEHSAPFYRLANFGWKGDLNPDDLAGILNANGLYSFTVGIPQLALSLYSIFVVEEGGTGDKAILFISASIGCISLIISLGNIVADVGQRLKELMRKERDLETRKTDAPSRYGPLKKEMEDMFNAKIEAERARLLTGLQGTTGTQDIIARTNEFAIVMEALENQMKRIFQGLEAMLRTDQDTELFPDEKMRGKHAQALMVSVKTIYCWIASFVLVHANLFLHMHLLRYAFGQINDGGNVFLYYAGLLTFIGMCIFKVGACWLFFIGAGRQSFKKKPTWLSLSENLSILIPLSTSVIFLGIGDGNGEFENHLPSECFGIVLSVSEVIISTCLESVDPKHLEALSTCCRKGRMRLEDESDRA